MPHPPPNFQQSNVHDAAQFAGKEIGGEEDGIVQPDARVASVNDEAIFSGLRGAAPMRTAPNGVILQASAVEPATAPSGPPVLPPPRPLSEAPPP